MRRICIAICISSFCSLSAWALQVDEKLTLRVLNISDTKKTLLINRGIEDGLAQGDHAKFFLTTGVVARGVIVNVSPTRSVWSLYRLVSPDYIKVDAVMNLKITEPVKITEDATKMIVKEPEIAATMGVDTSAGIPLAEGADDLDKALSKGDAKDLSSLEFVENLDISKRNIEPVVMFNIQTMSGKTTPSSSTSPEASGSNTMMNALLGCEFYSKSTTKWWSRFSAMPFLRLERNEVLTGSGQSTSASFSEYGFAIDYAFFKAFHLARTPIIYASAAFGAGKATDAYEFYLPVTKAQSGQSSGSTGFWSLGAGAKYYFMNGVGLRVQLDYVSRSVAYEADTNGVEWAMTMSGMRVMGGMSFRF